MKEVDSVRREASSAKKSQQVEWEDGVRNGDWLGELSVRGEFLWTGVETESLLRPSWVVVG